MKTLAIACVILAAMTAKCWAATESVAPTGKAGKTNATGKIVVDILQREARESVVDRAELLKPALELTPNHEAARGLSGFVYEKRRKEWLRYDEVPAAVKNDDGLANYHIVRTKYPETVDGQLELARWCIKKNLTDQARAHLTKVLELNPDNQEARHLLGQRLADGNWISESDITDAEAEAKKETAAFAQWKAKVEKIRTNLLRGKRQSDAARSELMAIRDPEAAIAIALILCADGGDTARVGIEALEKLLSHESAAALSQMAMLAPWNMLGQESARALHLQNKYDYVPQLLGLVKTPLQSRAEIYQSFNAGTLLYRHSFYRKDQDQPEMMILDTPYKHYFMVQQKKFRTRTTDQAIYQAGVKAEVQSKTKDIINRKIAMEKFQADAMMKATEREVAVAQYNMTAEALNSKICNILAQAVLLSQPAGKSPSESDELANNYQPKSAPEWSQWWNDYNEVYTPERPTRVVYVPNQNVVLMSVSTPVVRLSCLVGDTIIWTEWGPMAIKDVNVGDRVFACDVETGQLALKPVLKKTVRPIEKTGKLVAVTADGKKILASEGHVFWVAGEGWTKARDLKAGMRLHTMKGTVNIEVVGASETQETYNLIVADFHTFFAGDVKSLTHDNTIRQPTNMVVPGLEKND